ncbi:Uncharacterised protein [Mycobacteroides abscessus subsp. abscessus]|nr:Uncharacterised protein [Mycobacteroides abscessus subsp. abscessus]
MDTPATASLLNSVKASGICASIGRHPRIGLNPCSRCSFCISNAMR